MPTPNPTPASNVVKMQPKQPFRRHQCDPGQCAYCDIERARGNTFHPPHDASSRCESGKHAHCSCDTCF